MKRLSIGKDSDTYKTLFLINLLGFSVELCLGYTVSGDLWETERKLSQVVLFAGVE